MNCGCDEYGHCYNHNTSLLNGRPEVPEERAPPIGATERSAVVHPAHYNAHPSGVECIKIVEHFNFNVGNAVKYLWRAGLKSASPVEDLRKAAQYIAFEIERLGRSK